MIQTIHQYHKIICFEINATQIPHTLLGNWDRIENWLEPKTKGLSEPYII